ncbi:hypothetical protein BHE74_00027535 [Ensete ventricosum]|nr:hypothetical protein GW17_00032897 [Ensete ventricosum]RWW65174.1 hypothetical protein BHE74_00027535 [Ensete ventricosum]RZS07333.1 hypothetical protein BHM03_00038170 [Ensete ventricosum]
MERMSLAITVTFLLHKMDYQDLSHRNSISAYKPWGLHQQTSQCCPTYMCVLLVGFAAAGSHSFSSNKIIIAGHHVIWSVMPLYCYGLSFRLVQVEYFSSLCN